MQLLLPAFVGTPEVNKVYNCDALTLLRAMPDASVDAVITDPPYGLGLDTWDIATDTELIVNQIYRVLKMDSFFAFTIIAPYDMRWRLAANKAKFKFVDQVAWIKRNTGAYGAGLSHMHESIFLYRKGKARYFNTKGKYTDVKVPGLLFDVITVEGLQRYMDALWSYANGGKEQKMNSGRRHIAHVRRGGFESTRIPETVNFTNVWSFLPEHFTPGDHNLTKGHASVKPLLMFQRLVELLTPVNALIVDPFAGSGTTALAAQKTQRDFITCDVSAEYVQVAQRRLAQPYTPSYMPALEAS